MKENWIKKIAIILPVSGLTCILLYSLTAFGIPFDFGNINYFLAAFAILILVGVASFIVGSGIGFLFGVPRINKEVETNKSKYLPNTNLEQVSDWLTKIIIGVGLTQIGSIIKLIYQIGKETASGLATISDETETIFSASLIIYFLVSGFLISYLLTRINLSKILENSEKQ